MKNTFTKATITIYTDLSPEITKSIELSELARQAESGDFICDGMVAKEVAASELPEGVASFYNVLDVPSTITCNHCKTVVELVPDADEMDAILGGLAHLRACQAAKDHHGVDFEGEEEGEFILRQFDPNLVTNSNGVTRSPDQLIAILSEPTGEPPSGFKNADEQFRAIVTKMPDDIRREIIYYLRQVK